MIITKQWLNEFIDIENISPEEIVKKLNSIGHEVASLKTVDLDEKIVVGYVKSCEKHPNADKLSLCQVDVGSEVAQIVCGAKNVREGLYVVVSTVGAILPGGLKIKKAKLRDVESFGMICSSSELGLPDINDGIIELDNSIGKLEIGKPIKEYPILTDAVIEVELTANRGDCLSINGIARELKASFNLNSKSIDTKIDDDNSLGIGRVVSLTSASDVTSQNLFRVAKNSTFKTSLKHQIRLAFVEEDYKEEVEGLIKYSTHATGVLLNAFKCNALEDEENKVAISIKREDNVDAVYIDDKRVVQSGVKVVNDEVADKSSKEVIFEATYVNPDEISEIVHEQRLKTDDTFYRSSRGSEPDLDFGMAFLLKEIESSSDIYFYSESVQNKVEFEEKTISINLENVSAKIGQDIDKNRIVEILKSLKFSVQVTPEQNNLIVKVPLFRHDIINEADVVEEFVRIIGIDNIQSKPILMSEKRNFSPIYAMYKYERSLAIGAAAAGFSESLHFVFTDKKKLKEYGFETISDDLDVLNPITADLDTLRTSLIPNLLEATKLNINKSKSKVSLFEIGDVFNKDRGQNRSFALVASGDKELDFVGNSGKPEKLSFADFVSSVAKIFPNFKLENEKAPKAIFHPGQCASVIAHGVNVGTIAKIHPKVEKELGLPATFVCEINLDLLGEKFFLATEHSKFQPVKRDLSIVIDKSISFSEIRKAVDALELEYLQRIYPVDIYEDESLGDKFSLTIRTTLQSLTDTLSEENINSVVEKILELLKEEFKAELR